MSNEEPKVAPLPDLGQRTDEITIYAGPCSVEGPEMFDEVAQCVKGLGLELYTAAARSSPAPTRIPSRALARRPCR